MPGPAVTPEAPEAPEIYQYVVMREDTPHGTRYSFIGHAAADAASGTPELPDTANMIVLGVANEAELAAVAQLLSLAGVRHKVCRENRGGFAGQALSLGVDPWVAREKVRPLLASLRKLT